LGGQRVCSACKPAFLQRLTEGAAGPIGRPHRSVRKVPQPPLEILARDYQIDLGTVFKEAWTCFFSRTGVMLFRGILAIIMIVVMSMVPLVGLVLTGPMLGGLVLFYLRRQRA